LTELLKQSFASGQIKNGIAIWRRHYMGMFMLLCLVLLIPNGLFRSRRAIFGQFG
jgi:hypothetical protein